MHDTVGGMRIALLVLVASLLSSLACDDAGEEPPAIVRLDPWREVTDEQLAAEIEAAKERAAARDKQVLLDFVATWCDDCREVVRVSKLEPAASVLHERYEYVPINVGDWDRATELRERFAVRRIATLVVLEPDGTKVAQTTLEPVSREERLTPQDLAAWLREPRTEASPR